MVTIITIILAIQLVIILGIGIFYIGKKLYKTGILKYVVIFLLLYFLGCLIELVFPNIRNIGYIASFFITMFVILILILIETVYSYIKLQLK